MTTTAGWLRQLGAVAALVVTGAWEVWAQSADSPATTTFPATDAAKGGVATVMVVGLVLVLLVGIGILVKMVDARRRREDEMAGLQGRISDALLTDGLLVGLPVTATVHTPFWRSAPATVSLTGTVPSVELRDAARRVAEREMQSRGVQFEIEDRVMVDPRMFRQVA